MSDAKILGVCSWLEDFLGVDAKILRVIFIVGVLFYGTGIGIYLILWVVKMVID